MKRLLLIGMFLFAAGLTHAQSKGPAYKFAHQIMDQVGAVVVDVDTTENRQSLVLYASISKDFKDVKEGIRVAATSSIDNPKVLRDWYLDYKGKDYYSITYFVQGGTLKIMFIPINKEKSSMILMTTDKQDIRWR